MGSVSDTTELDLLRVENDLLRRKLSTIELGLDAVDYRHRLQSEAKAQSEVASPNAQRALWSDDEHELFSGEPQQKELGGLRDLLRRIAVAKDEAMQFHEIGKEQLADDVQHLYRLLSRAKRGRADLAQRVCELQSALALEKRKSADLALEVEAGERSFDAISRRDRDVAERRILKADERAARRDAELEHVLHWVATRQQALLATTEQLSQQLARADADAVDVAEHALRDQRAQLDELRADVAALEPTSVVQ